MDAMDTAAPETRSRGRSQALLYNTARPHSRLGWMRPAGYAAARQSAALRSTDGSASQTAAITAQEGITDRQTPMARRLVAIRSRNHPSLRNSRFAQAGMIRAPAEVRASAGAHRIRGCDALSSDETDAGHIDGRGLTNGELPALGSRNLYWRIKGSRPIAIAARFFKRPGTCNRVYCRCLARPWRLRAAAMPR